MPRILPLTHPMLPIPGANLVDLAGSDDAYLQGDKKAKTLGGPCVKLSRLVEEIVYGARSTLAMAYADSTVQLKLVPGRIWGETAQIGPSPAKVMIINKISCDMDVSTGFSFSGPIGVFVHEECRRQNLDPTRWYVTSLFKSRNPSGKASDTTLKTAYLKEWYHILFQEIAVVKPDIIVGFGPDVLSALYGKKVTVRDHEREPFEITYPCIGNKGIGHKKALVVATISPVAALKSKKTAERQQFTAQFSVLKALLDEAQQQRIRSGKQEEVEHFNVDNLDDLIRLRKRINAECEDNLIGADAEWSGSHPQNHNGYLRMIQVSWAPKKAAAIVINDTEGRSVYPLDKWRRVRHEVNSIFKGKQIAGHFFDSDLEWIQYAGFDVLSQFKVPETWWEYEEAFRKHESVGFDTGLAAHAVNETGDFGLKGLSAYFIPEAPRYDAELRRWLRRYKETTSNDVDGYGKVPDYVLGPYGCYDADVTRRLVAPLSKLLYADQFNNMSWEPFWMSMRVLFPILEMNCGGLKINYRKLLELNRQYRRESKALLTKLRQWAGWPEFNPGSSQHLVAFLYGNRYLKDKEVLPEGARGLELKPVITTDKPAMRWTDVERQNLEDQKTPAANKSALRILQFEGYESLQKIDDQLIKVDRSEQLSWIKDWKLLAQTLRYVLKTPEREYSVTESGKKVYGDYIRDARGRLVFSKGVPKEICDDNRVRTHMYSTLSTGRFATSRPNMQNLGKNSEKFLKAALGERYTYPIKSIFQADKGSLLVEIDYIGAELMVMAVLSNDATMIDHALRNQLSEDDPNYYDIHSHIAVNAFRLDCEPTKKGLEAAGHDRIRNVAKAVVFGIAYGRGAAAIALQAREEGTLISVMEAQETIQALFNLYPGLQSYFATCEQRAYNERWLRGPRGRLRRFYMTQDSKMLSDFGRQAKNFNIQGLVADTMSRALDHVYTYRNENKMKFKISNQIHDAMILNVPYAEVEHVVKVVIPECMIRKVPIIACDCDGNRISDKEYTFGVSFDFYKEWGINLKPEQLLEKYQIDVRGAV